MLQLDDGTYISESTAITEDLDNLDGHPTLTGTTPRDKAMIHMMQRRAEAEVLDAIGNYFHNATPGLGPVLQVYRNPEWIDRTAWGAQQRDRALAGLRYFDTVLAGQPYLAGDHFSMADITLFAGLMFADAAGIAIPAEYGALAAWRSRVSDLPSVKNRGGQAFEAEDRRRLGF